MFKHEVRIPPDWAERRPDNRMDDPVDAEVLAHWDRAGTDDEVVLIEGPDGADPKYTIQWLKGDSLAHGHEASSEEEYRAVVSVITHMVNHCNASGFDPSEYDGILDRDTWETPRILTVENPGRMTVAVERVPTSVDLFQTTDKEDVELKDYIYNSWDAELYQVSSIGDETAVLEVINSRESIEVTLDWLEIDRGRLIPMERM